MVQRKQQKRIASQAEAFGKRFSSNHQQDTRSKGSGGDDVKKMKKQPHPTGAANGSPNYMKATTSSGARKERLQVTDDSSITTDTNRIIKSSSSPNSSKPASSPIVVSGNKPMKFLTRNPSLKPTRSSMKKSSGVAMHPKKVVSRATCSSTLKDSKFPEASDLKSEGIDSEPPTVMKVCPYTYCSLNGHKHEPLPPLQCFLSARRRMIKNQKSMKLKRMSSLIAISRMPSELLINPLFEESGNDFSVQIYGRQEAQTRKVDEDDKKSTGGIHDINCPEFLKKKSPDNDDDWEFTMNQMYESSLNVNYKDDLDLSSYLSKEEMDALMDTLEYVEYDQENYTVKLSECDMENISNKKSEIMAENEAKLSAFGEVIIHCEEEVGSYPDSPNYSEDLDDEFDPIFCSLLEAYNADDEWFLYQNMSSKKERTGGNVELSNEDAVVEAMGNNPEIGVGFNEEGNGCEVREPANHYYFSRDQSVEIRAGGNLKESEDEQQTSGSEGSTSKHLKEDCNEGIGILEIEDLTSFDADGCVAFNSSSSGKETADNQNLASVKQLTEVSIKQKARYGMIRKNKTEYLENEREFNPRAPQFLPVEPELEPEKVNLRYQLMDERKKAEDWMIDYALRQAIRKLAPEREKKVELIVDAFESIMPLLTYETPDKQCQISLTSNLYKHAVRILQANKT